MINRLAAESTLKVPLRGNAYFSINKKLMCFQGDAQLRVRALTKEAKDIEVPFNSAPLRFSLSNQHSWLYELTQSHLLQVYQLEYVNGIADGSFKKIAILHNVEDYNEIKSGLVVVAKNKIMKVISFAEMQEATEVNLNIDANLLKSVTEIDGSFGLTVSNGSQRVLVTRGGKQEQQQQNEAETLTECFDRVPSTTRYQKTSSLTYLGQPLALYRDRYAFQRKFQRQVEIFDIQESRLIGKFSLQGTIKLAQVRENLLLVIANRDQTDYFHFFVLHPEPTNLQPLITNRVVYEKSKGDYYSAFNLLSNEASAILDKKKGADISDTTISKLSDNTSTILYALNRAKEKVEIIKVEHSKLLKSPFGEERLDKIVYSKKGAKQEEAVEVERARVHSSIQLKAGQKSMEEMQRKFVEGLIDIKLKGVMRKFQELQKKVEQLERLIRGINQKVESNLAKINRDEIRQNVEKLFDSLTPQFQKYFSEIFKQVAGVLDQGVTYYNMKLAKEADLHKEALTQIVTETFKATEDIVQLARREQTVTEKTEEHLRSILEAKKKWKKSTEDYETKLKEVPSPNLKSQPKSQAKPEGKVFVRADLNFTSGKRQG